MSRRWVIAVALTIVVGGAFTACGTSANDFEAGECTNDSLSGTVDDTDTIDCDEVHAAEAFAQFELDGEDFPGDDDIQSQAAEGCWGERFEDYVGVPYEESIYEVDPIVPSQDSWDAGDRTVICIISATTDGSELEGSAEGAEA